MDYVLISDLAREFGIDRSNMRKYILKHGFQPFSVRTPHTRGQATLALTPEDAEAVRALRARQGFHHENPHPIDTNTGVFYIIQVVPDLAPNRVKLGFTTDIMARLAALQTSAPTATIVKTWPCKRAWEPCAITSMTRIGCRHIANEVYECDDIEALVARGDEFFALFPEP